jgi:glutamate/tyrosine decarboxylase-like PLP-dependent enzyme
VALPVLPSTAFVDPFGENCEAIASVLHKVADQILSYLSNASHHTPLPAVHKPVFEGISEYPTDITSLLDHLNTIMAESMNPAHPGYLGHMDPLPTTASIIGDWLAAALNNNMLSVEMSPALSRLEPLLMREIAQFFGLGEQAGGLLVSGGTLANLQALTVARNVKLNCLKTGLSQQGRQPVLFASELAHTSIQKAAMLLGLGLDGVIPIPTNANAQMDTDALEIRIRKALMAGQQPFAIVATAGTTVTGNIDPLPQIYGIAQRHSLWLHVDAAYGGAIAFSPTHRYRLQGIQQADSVTFNPQKWLYVTKTCASVLFRNMALLDSNFRVSAPYMNTETDWTNLGEISVQGTRHADILKLWLSLQHLGKTGCAALVDASYSLTDHLVAQIHQRPYLQLASPPEMNVICFRGCPSYLPESEWNHWNISLQQFLLDREKTFLSLPIFRQQRWLKAVLLNPYTTKEQITQLFASIDRFYQAQQEQ